jgi:methyl-accepting chemotaxis protein
MASKASALAVGLTGVSAAAVPLTATLGAMATAAGGVATGFGAVIGTGMFAYGEQLAGQNEERLQQIDRKIAKLEEQKATTEGLTNSQQNQLDNLRQTREQVAETTSATGALSEELEPAKEQFRESALAIGQDFIPLMRDTIDALPEFIRRIEDSVGNLQPFADALRDAGQAGMTVIPALVEQMMDMGRDALPAVRRFGSFVSDNAVPALEGMADTGDRVASMLPPLGSSAASVVPEVNDLGLSILETTIPAMRDAGSTVTDLIERFNSLDSRTQNLSITAAISAPAVAGVVSKLAMINPMLGAVAGGVAALGAAWATNFGNIREKTTAVAEEAQPMLNEASETLVSLGEDASEAAEPVADNFEPAVSSASDTLDDLTSGRYGSAFDSLVQSAEQASSGVRQTLIGGSGDGGGGSGGIVGAVDSSLSKAQTWLSTTGGDMMREGFEAVLASTDDVADDLSAILIGPDGTSGALSAMVDNGTQFLSQTAPRLIGDGMQAVGAGIRMGLKDITNPLRGKDSEIWDLLIDGSKWLVTNIPGLFVSVGQGVVKGILKGFQGLVQGLIGAEEGEITQAFSDIISGIDPIDTFMSVGSDIVDGIVTGLGNAKSSIGGWITGKLNGAIETINDILPGQIRIPEFSVGGGPADTGPAGKIPGVPEKVDVPEISVGGDSVNVPGVPIPTAETGGLIPDTTPILAHAGERVLPEQQVTDRGEASFDPTSVADGFDRSETAEQMRRALDRIDEAVRSDGTIRVRERDLVRGLQRLFDQHEASL